MQKVLFFPQYFSYFKHLKSLKSQHLLEKLIYLQEVLFSVKREMSYYLKKEQISGNRLSKINLIQGETSFHTPLTNIRSYFKY